MAGSSHEDSATLAEPGSPTENVEKKVKPEDVEAAPAAKPPGPPAMSYPDGGVKAWTTTFGAFLVLFATFGYINAFGVYETYYISHQFSSETSSNISWIGSIQVWLMFSAGIVTGPLFDAGYFRILMAVGSTIYIVCLFMTSLCTKYWQAMLAQGIGQGLGIGILFVPSVSILGHYFQKKRGIAIGICVVGSSVGGVIFPIMLNRLFISHGFQRGVQYTGYLILGCLVIANVIMTPRLPGRKKGTGPKPPGPITIFAELRYTLTTLGAFFVAWGLFFPFFYLEAFCEAHGLPENVSFYSLSILNAASIFGRLGPNFVADKIGPFNLLIPVSACTSILIWAMFGAGSTGGAITFAILYGFFSGGYVSLISPALVSMAKHFSEIGVRIGYAFVIVGLAALSGTPICGALLTKTNGGFYAPIIFSGVVTAIGTCFFIAARFIQAKEKGTWKV